MGLEPVEFIQAVEKALGLSIPDSDTEALTTPRQLVQYLQVRLADRNGPGDHVENLIRRLLAEACEHERFTLDTDFRDIFP